jgi:hypothetical protein
VQEQEPNSKTQYHPIIMIPDASLSTAKLRHLVYPCTNTAYRFWYLKSLNPESSHLYCSPSTRAITPQKSCNLFDWATSMKSNVKFKQEITLPHPGRAEIGGSENEQQRELRGHWPLEFLERSWRDSILTQYPFGYQWSLHYPNHHPRAHLNLETRYILKLPYRFQSITESNCN